ncbi:hypothetical protein RvY_02146 [Ramazzottius varieornatus]|uniref:Uncharacterized protein n=1 Tax=Ramazzottius varieornatus TaxID=947166 RepID=A0A1D1UIQ6_RAMVA|nr:hypothetical protein RvY_02146 [Ramazzottius varieornatus]
MKLSTWLERSLKRMKRDDDDDSESSEEQHNNVNYFYRPGPSTPTLNTRALLWGIVFSSLTGRGGSAGRAGKGGAAGGTAGGGDKEGPEGETPIIAPPPEPGVPFFGGFEGFPFDIGDLFADEDSDSQFPRIAELDVPPPPASSRESRGPAQPRSARP